MNEIKRKKRRKMEDIIFVKKGNKKSLSKKSEKIKVSTIPLRIKNKIASQTAEEKITEYSRLENLLVFNRKLILGIAFVLFVFFVIFAIKIFYSNDKIVPAHIQNVIRELENENEIFEKDILEIKNNKDILKKINNRIGEMSE